MSSFAALMALSATQTRQSEALVKSQMAEKQRKEAEKRKQQEERERKEKEMEAKMRLKILDDQKREQERQKKFEAERQAKELALKKKEDEQRDALRYGPKRSKSEYPSSNHASREKRKSSSDDEGAGGAALTREEKRQQRLQRELNYGLGAGRRSTQGAYRKAGRRLPGGAVDIAATDGASSSNAYRSVKDRLAHEPNGLIKLNVNKRDTRTIDEITQDLARHKASKVLSGDQAKTFDNWFGKSKQSGTQTGDQSRASSIFSSRSNSPVSTKPPEPKPISSKPAARATKSLSGTPPAPSRQHSQPKPSTSTYVSSSRTPVTTVSKGTGISVKAMSKPFDKLHINGSSSKIATGKAPMKSTSSLNKSASAPRTSTAPSRPSTAASSAPKKRPRSPSLSDSPPPPKRRSAPPANSISAEIWKMFGKDRNAYVGRDVLSDEEDMEADAMDLEHEELYSARLARKEDELALEEERRHEEEKRRRKKERDSRERRG